MSWASFCTRFNGTDLRGADFTGADLSGVTFVGAKLTGAKFDDARLNFCSVDLLVEGLKQAANGEQEKIDSVEFIAIHGNWSWKDFNEANRQNPHPQATWMIEVIRQRLDDEPRHHGPRNKLDRYLQARLEEHASR